MPPPENASNNLDGSEVLTETGPPTASLSAWCNHGLEVCWAVRWGTSFGTVFAGESCRAYQGGWFSA